MNTIKKAVIPAAGFGTRFLPWTKAIPKELLPLPVMPVLDKIVRILVDAGIEEIAMVLSPGKEAIKNHFSPNEALEKDLIASGKTQELAKIRELNSLAKITYLYQEGPKGNATPILNAKEWVGSEPFIVTWADDFIRCQPSMPKQLIAAYDKFPGQLVAGLNLPRPEDKERYGYVSGKKVAPNIIKVEKIVEKPGDSAPSDIGVVSDYLYTQKIFEAIANITPPPGEELVYTLALEYLINKGEPVYCVYSEDGSYADQGNPTEYVKSLITEATQDETIGEEITKWIKDNY